MRRVILLIDAHFRVIPFFIVRIFIFFGNKPLLICTSVPLLYLLLDVLLFQFEFVCVARVRQRILRLALGHVVVQLPVRRVLNLLALAVVNILSINSILLPVGSVQLPNETRQQLLFVCMKYTWLSLRTLSQYSMLNPKLT